MKSWDGWDIDAETNRLSSLIEIIEKNTNQTPAKLISLSCERVCISICGSLEQGINKIFTDYAKSSESQWVVNLAEYRVEQLRNPKIENIKELVKLFDPTFEKELNRAWINDQDNEKKYIHELVNKRISLAHGKGNHGQITTGDLKNYFKAYESLLTRLLMHFQRGHNL